MDINGDLTHDLSSNDTHSGDISSNDIVGVDRCQSCDTFVAMPDVTIGGNVVFGKNSDRPRGEVQEVVAIPRTRHEDGKVLQVENFCLSSGASRVLWSSG